MSSPSSPPRTLRSDSSAGGIECYQTQGVPPGLTEFAQRRTVVQSYQPFSDADPDRPTLAAVHRLRYEIYVTEMQKPYPHADHSDRKLRDELDLASSHLISLDRCGVVGSVMLTAWDGWRHNLEVSKIFERTGAPVVSSRQTVFVSRLVVRRSRRPHGKIAIALMRACYGAAFAWGATAGFCHTRQELLPLFLKFGWQPVGDSFFHQDSQTTQQAVLIPIVDPCAPELAESPFSASRFKSDLVSAVSNTSGSQDRSALLKGTFS